MDDFRAKGELVVSLSRLEELTARQKRVLHRILLRAESRDQSTDDTARVRMPFARNEEGTRKQPDRAAFIAPRHGIGATSQRRRPSSSRSYQLLFTYVT